MYKLIIKLDIDTYTVVIDQKIMLMCISARAVQFLINGGI